jgi:hypothetical protein
VRWLVLSFRCFCRWVIRPASLTVEKRSITESFCLRNGHLGWLIFRLPPAELGIHPTESRGPAAGHHALSLICDDIHTTVRDLRAKGVEVKGEPADHGYGITVMVTLPGGVEIQVYEPRHPLAIKAT